MCVVQVQDRISPLTLYGHNGGDNSLPILVALGSDMLESGFLFTVKPRIEAMSLPGFTYNGRQKDTTGYECWLVAVGCLRALWEGWVASLVLQG